MPLVRIEIIKGKDREYKKALADCVHEGLMEAFGISDDDRFQRIGRVRQSHQLKFSIYWHRLFHSHISLLNSYYSCERQM